MWASVTVKTPPEALPLTAADLRDRLRIDDPTEDAILGDFLVGAAAEIDGPHGIGVALMAQTWTLTIDKFRPDIALPGWPITGVAEIRYLDPDGAAQIVPPADYRLAIIGEAGRLVPSPTATWPATLAGPGVIEIDYTLGRDSSAEVDGGLITALALLAGHYYENREAVIVGTNASETPLGVVHILNRYRRGLVAG